MIAHAKEGRMRMAFLVLVLFGLGLGKAGANPYRWCAVYSGGDFGNGATNCYFVTREQCEWTVSGIGGFCVPNQFYDGRPVVTPGEAVRRAKQPVRQRQ